MDLLVLSVRGALCPNKNSAAVPKSDVHLREHAEHRLINQSRSRSCMRRVRLSWRPFNVSDRVLCFGLYRRLPNLMALPMRTWLFALTARRGRSAMRFVAHALLRYSS